MAAAPQWRYLRESIFPTLTWLLSFLTCACNHCGFRLSVQPLLRLFLSLQGLYLNSIEPVVWSWFNMTARVFVRETQLSCQRWHRACQVLSDASQTLFAVFVFGTCKQRHFTKVSLFFVTVCVFLSSQGQVRGAATTWQAAVKSWNHDSLLLHETMMKTTDQNMLCFCNFSWNHIIDTQSRPTGQKWPEVRRFRSFQASSSFKTNPQPSWWLTGLLQLLYSITTARICSFDQMWKNIWRSSVHILSHASCSCQPWVICWHISHATSCNCEFNGLPSLTPGCIQQDHTATLWTQARVASGLVCKHRPLVFTQGPWVTLSVSNSNSSHVT